MRRGQRVPHRVRHGAGILTPIRDSLDPGDPVNVVLADSRDAESSAIAPRPGTPPVISRSRRPGGVGEVVDRHASTRPRTGEICASTIRP